MKLSEKEKGGVHKKFQKVMTAPASFDLFIAIHDFVEEIERNPSLSKSLTSANKSNTELRIPIKYSHLKQIHQGLKDVEDDSNDDLGHSRFMTRIELAQIKNNDLSETNSFWKKREFFRKIASEIYQKISL